MGMVGELLKTVLHGWHCDRGAKMVEFAGYEMPLQYEGIKGEHLGTRESVGFFDVSHMGQLCLEGKDGAEVLERVVGADIQGLAKGKWCYTQFLNEGGGIEDDLLVGRDSVDGGKLHLVVNASRKKEDEALLRGVIEGGDDVRCERIEKRSLVAVQGPKSCEVLSHFWEGLEVMGKMEMRWEGATLISRTGYTGSDGFEIAMGEEEVEAFASRLLEDERVRACGLGARNTLRLEAGMCLYGHDLDFQTTPIEAGLGWSVGRKREGYRGYEVLKRQREEGVKRKRVGFLLGERAIVRDGAKVYTGEGEEIGRVTSGCFSPSLGVGIGMGYVPLSFSEEGMVLKCDIRGRLHDAKVVRMPFLDF